MRSSEKIDALAADLVKAQAEIENAALNKTNPHFKSRYADLAGIREAVVPVFAKHNLAVVQPTSFEGGVTVVETVLMHKTGQWMSGQFPVVCAANANAQQVGSATTYARRYALAAMAGITAEEDDDGNAASAPQKPKVEQKVEPKAEPKSEPKQDAQSGSEDDADLKAYKLFAKAFSEFILSCKTEDELREYRAQNIKELDNLKERYPSVFEKVGNLYKARMGDLKGK